MTNEITKETENILKDLPRYNIYLGSLTNPDNIFEASHNGIDAKISYANISTYPRKIEIDIEFSKDISMDYIEEISLNTGYSKEYLNTLLTKYKKKANKGIFRISLPVVRKNVGSYCGDVFVSPEHFQKGILIFDMYAGRFPVSIKEEHKKLLHDFYIKFEELLKSLDREQETFEHHCPLISGIETKNAFCKKCIDSYNKYLEKGGESLVKTA